MAFICPICHVASIHEKSGRFECKICHKKFEKISLEKPFACEVCQSRFPEKSSLKRHLRIHAGEKPFACKVCQMRFSEKSSLKRHLGIHAKGERFQCDDCPQVFHSKRYLGIHRVACHSEKKFVCETCGKNCGTRHTLRVHLRVHSEDRPFRCDHCEFSSKCKHHLKKHQARCHSITRPETSEQGRLARSDDREELPRAIEKPGGNDRSGGAKYNLRVRRKTPNSIDQNDGEAEDTGSNPGGNSESRGDRQDNDRDLAEPDEESGLDDLVVLDDEDEQNGDKDRSDEPAENNESRAAKEYDMSLSSDDEDDLPESSTVTSADLTVVYGVEYRGPDESD